MYPGHSTDIQIAWSSYSQVCLIGDKWQVFDELYRQEPKLTAEQIDEARTPIEGACRRAAAARVLRVSLQRLYTAVNGQGRCTSGQGTGTRRRPDRRVP
jgi:hypothetical protein